MPIATTPKAITLKAATASAALPSATAYGCRASKNWRALLGSYSAYILLDEFRSII